MSPWTPRRPGLRRRSSAPGSCCPLADPVLPAAGHRRLPGRSTASTRRSSSFGHDPPNYQSYDKAMDVFYLSMAYLSTLRNWESMPAFRIGWFLFFYRLVGALLFELTHLRWLLLVFPNVFEYFFIAYETIRSRWQPVHLLVGWWLSAAALIWVFVKLPQEYWLHVAKLDVTDEIGLHHWILGLIIVRPARHRGRLPEAGAARGCRRPDWSWRFRPEPLPGGDRRAGGAGRLADAVRRDPVCGHPGEGGAGRPGLGDLLPDAARLHRLDQRRLHRRRRRRGGQLRHHPGRRPPALDDPLDGARVRRPARDERRPGPGRRPAARPPQRAAGRLRHASSS